jgi:CSLREA domain-containing protein
MEARAASACIFLCALLSLRADAIVYEVNSAGDASDANPNDGICETQTPGVCTLRAAVQQANVTGGEIRIPAMTITLGDTIDITHDMTLAGAGMRRSIVSGNALFRIFHVGDFPNHTPVVSISDMTLRDGHVPDYGGAIYVVQTQLTVERCFFANNYSSGYGGAILADYLTDLRIRDSVFTDNHAAATSGEGGALFVYNSTSTFLNTAIYQNSAGSAGALGFSRASGTLTNCTIGGNLADANGGGIALFSDTQAGSSVGLYNTTVAGNRATSGSGGGIYVADNTSSSAAIQNTIVSSNTRIGKGVVVSSDCAGTIASQGSSIVSGICTVSGSYSTANPLLGPLQDNGGTNGPTYALMSGSPAIDGGSLGGCPLVDQRGVQRQTGGHCDMGAYEHAPCGDVDGDGSVSLADIFFLINYLFAGGPSPPGLANVNGDGTITIGDVFYLVNALFAGGPAPNCPGT